MYIPALVELVPDRVEDDPQMFLMGSVSNFRLVAIGILLSVSVAVCSLAIYILYVKYEEDNRKRLY